MTTLLRSRGRSYISPSPSFLILSQAVLNSGANIEKRAKIMNAAAMGRVKNMDMLPFDRIIVNK